MAMLLDEQIRHNKRITVRLFVILFVILWAMAFAIGIILQIQPIMTGFFALIFGLIYLGMASGFSVQAIIKAARARPADPRIRAEKLLLYKVEEMALAAGLPVPKTYVQESRDINAFATGRKPEEGVICVTTGALAALNQEELEGVLAHEMSHIKNYDIRVATFAVALIGIIAMLAEMVWWGMIMGGGRRDRSQSNPIMMIVAIALIILAPLLSRMTYMAINRRREYLADSTGAHLTRNPEGLASALEKISKTEPQESHKSDRTVASLYLANPFKRVRRDSMWSTHPPIDERIRRLRGMR